MNRCASPHKKMVETGCLMTSAVRQQKDEAPSCGTRMQCSITAASAGLAVAVALVPGLPGMLNVGCQGCVQGTLRDIEPPSPSYPTFCKPTRMPALLTPLPVLIACVYALQKPSSAQCVPTADARGNTSSLPP